MIHILVGIVVGIVVGRVVGGVVGVDREGKSCGVVVAGVVAGGPSRVSCA